MQAGGRPVTSDKIYYVKWRTRLGRAPRYAKSAGATGTFLPRAADVYITRRDADGEALWGFGTPKAADMGPWVVGHWSDETLCLLRRNARWIDCDLGWKRLVPYLHSDPTQAQRKNHEDRDR